MVKFTSLQIWWMCILNNILSLWIFIYIYIYVRERERDRVVLFWIIAKQIKTSNLKVAYDLKNHSITLPFAPLTSARANLASICGIFLSPETWALSQTRGCAMIHRSTPGNKKLQIWLQIIWQSKCHASKINSLISSSWNCCETSCARSLFRPHRHGSDD